MASIREIHTLEKVAMPTILALMAHPDDAEILCGGTLLRLSREQGYDVHVATCTPGDAGSADLGPEAIAAKRRNEGEAGAKRLGGTYHCLEMRDFQVAYTPETVRRAVEVMRLVNPSIVITHPRFDYMGDHEQCHHLARMPPRLRALRDFFRVLSSLERFFQRAATVRERGPTRSHGEPAPSRSRLVQGIESRLHELVGRAVPAALLCGGAA